MPSKISLRTPARAAAAWRAASPRGDQPGSETTNAASPTSPGSDSIAPSPNTTSERGGMRSASAAMAGPPKRSGVPVSSS